MRKILLVSLLFVAACAPRPETMPTPQPVMPASSESDRHDHRTLNGMTAGELIAHFGKPKLQIVEGQSTKLQFAGPSCLLDVYLYPPESGSGAPRASYIEARNFQGGNVSAQTCAASIANR